MAPRDAEALPPLASPAARPLSGTALFLLVFLPYALGHYLSTLVRSVNAVLAPQLTAALALTPGELGLLTSAFFLAFAVAQLPVGLSLDRWGPRTVQLSMLLVAAVGALAFSGGRTFAELVCARAIMGLGLGGCFMSAVKALSSWIAPARLPSMHGYLIAAGGLGSASATLPVQAALHHTDWRGLFVALAVASAAIALLIRALTPASPRREPLPVTWAGLAEVYRHPVFRRAALLVLPAHAVFFGLQGLWLGRWLSDVGGYSEPQVAYLLYLGMAAIIFGAIAAGMATEWAARRGIPAMRVAAVGIALFVALQLAMMGGYAPGAGLLSVLFTLLGTITGIEYAIVAQGMPKEMTGRASTCLNLLIFAGAFAVQAGFGQVLECWRPSPGNHYPAQAYQLAFGLCALLQLPGLAHYLVRHQQQGIR
jgi:MFS family permease